MRPPRAHLALIAATAALLVAPTGAAAEAVPPENSAANQYTETYPTAGGDRETQRADEIGGGSGRGKNSGGSGGGITPERERALEAAGNDGRDVVELVESTAPTAATGSATDDGTAGDGSPAKGNSSPATGGAADEGLGGTGGGSSATEEVLGQATGAATSGELGPLLPLLVLATMVWAAGFFWRRRSEA